MQDILEVLESAVPATVTAVDHEDLARRARSRILRRRLAASSALVMLAVGGGVSFTWLRSGSDVIADGPAGSTEVSTEADADRAEARDDDGTEAADTTDPSPLDLATLEEGFGTWTELPAAGLSDLPTDSNSERPGFVTGEAMDDGRVVIRSAGQDGCGPDDSCANRIGVLDPDTGDWRELPPFPDGFGPTNPSLGMQVVGERILFDVAPGYALHWYYAVFDTATWAWIPVPEPDDRLIGAQSAWTGDTLTLEARDSATFTAATWTVGEAGWRWVAAPPDGLSMQGATVSAVGDDLYHVDPGGRAAIYHLADDSWTMLPRVPGPVGQFWLRPFAGSVAAMYADRASDDPAYLLLEGDEWVARAAPAGAEGLPLALVSVFDGVLRFDGSRSIEEMGPLWYDVGAGWETGGTVYAWSDGGALIAPTSVETVSFDGTPQGDAPEPQAIRYRTGVDTWVTSAPAPFTGNETVRVVPVGDRALVLAEVAGGGLSAWLLDPTG